MYGVSGEKRPIFVESDAVLYNIGDPIIGGCHLFSTIVRDRVVQLCPPARPYIKSPSKGF